MRVSSTESSSIPHCISLSAQPLLEVKRAIATACSLDRLCLLSTSRLLCFSNSLNAPTLFLSSLFSSSISCNWHLAAAAALNVSWSRHLASPRLWKLFHLVFSVNARSRSSASDNSAAMSISALEEAVSKLSRKQILCFLAIAEVEEQWFSFMVRLPMEVSS